MGGESELDRYVKLKNKHMELMFLNIFGRFWRERVSSSPRGSSESWSGEGCPAQGEAAGI